ncbi:MAG: hypothetical protein V1747_02770 [Candidatus Omnitrophota bacterium]
MDHKVKITLATTGVLLLLIIATGLYSTFNPKSVKTELLNEISKTAPVYKQGSKVGLGSKAKTNVKENSYYFLDKKVERAQVDPHDNLNANNDELDDFFVSDISEPIDMVANFDDDYVQAPEIDISMNEAELDHPMEN